MARTALTSWHYFCAVLQGFIVYFLLPLFVHFLITFLSIDQVSPTSAWAFRAYGWVVEICQSHWRTQDIDLRHPCALLDLMQSSSLMALCSSFLLCCYSLSLETCSIKEPIVTNFEMVSSLDIACVLRASSSK